MSGPRLSIGTAGPMLSGNYFAALRYITHRNTDGTHADADADGYVMMPNVDLIKETVDSMSATRSYDANITAFNAIKMMATKALEIGR